MERKVKVQDMPATWVVVDSKLSDETIRKQWQLKHSLKKTLSEEQKRRERVSVREGKISNRKRG
jgi:hypothetical protein